MKIIRNITITTIIGIIVYYFTLPAINLNNFGFWMFLLFIIMVYNITSAMFGIKNAAKKIFNSKHIEIKPNTKSGIIMWLSVPTIFVVIILINLICSPMFNAKSYHNRIKVDESRDFLEDIEEVDFNRLPLIDKESSKVLGDRVMGQMSELVSQFSVSEQYKQINYNDSIVRVTPLEYASTYKWFSNRKEGVKGYIIVDSVTGETKLQKLEKGMKYVESAHFNENLYRKLRFSYPTVNFGNISFEIDNEGNPYWIVPTIKYTAVGLKAKVTGAIILDPITGESEKYDLKDVPSWVDNVHDAELLIEQLDDWGTYKGGFLNSMFGQKNVVNTTDGYNYLVMNDDVYLYTGITSVVSDESNLGFVLTNMRTGETKYYVVPGAEEYSAMSSAEGQVQDMKYKSTFPLLINLNGKPTYVVSLKDSSGLVKMYAFIDVKDYQKVVATDSSKGINAAAQNYLNNASFEIKEDELTTKTITINMITPVNINGNTYYYIESTENKKYRASILLNDTLPFIKNGDTINISYKRENTVTEIDKIN